MQMIYRARHNLYKKDLLHLNIRKTVFLCAYFREWQ